MSYVEGYLYVRAKKVQRSPLNEWLFVSYFNNLLVIPLNSLFCDNQR